MTILPPRQTRHRAGTGCAISRLEISCATSGEGDPVLFYHSVTNPGIVGVAKVVRESYPDHTAWNPEDRHYDPRSTADKPLWFMVDVQFVEKFASPIPLGSLRGIKGLEKMELLKKGSRLSVMPVAREEFEIILRLARVT